MSNNEPDENDWLGHSKTGPSPLVILVMAGTVGTLQVLSGLLLLVICTLLWVRHKPEGFAFVDGDMGTFLVLLGLMVGGWILAKRIKTEMAKSKAPS